MSKDDDDIDPVVLRRAGRFVMRAVGLVAVGILVLMSFYTVNERERAVVLRLGAVVAEAGPGFHLKVPFTDSVNKIPITSQAKVYDRIQAYSRDQQQAELRVSVNFHVVDPRQLYATYGSIDAYILRVLDTQVPTSSENVFGQFDAVRAVQQRAELIAGLSTAIKERASGGPVVVDSVQIENMDFDEVYETSIADLMKATVAQRQAEAEKAQRLTRADALAYETTAQANAQATAVRARGLAEAEAIRARADALRQNQDLVALQAVEKWNGVLPTQMIPGGTVPFLNLVK